ncbi:hypothetical protein Rhein_3322 [Rheinheimera sp. A13L]|nr:hypothetical protein Rhein_3322 [Rheinheimera sp. A13L]
MRQKLSAPGAITKHLSRFGPYRWNTKPATATSSKAIAVKDGVITVLATQTYTQVTSRCEFQSRRALAMQGSLAKQCRYLARQANTAVQSPCDSQRAGLKALYAALTVVALEPLKLPTAALPKGLLSPAEFCILKLLGYKTA